MRVANPPSSCSLMNRAYGVPQAPATVARPSLAKVLWQNGVHVFARTESAWYQGRMALMWVGLQVPLI